MKRTILLPLIFIAMLITGCSSDYDDLDMYVEDNKEICLYDIISKEFSYYEKARIEYDFQASINLKENLGKISVYYVNSYINSISFPYDSKHYNHDYECTYVLGNDSIIVYERDTIKGGRLYCKHHIEE